MSIIAWIVLGAIAGYIAGFLVKGDEGLGVIGHIVLGIVGALVGGFLASLLFNSKPIDGPFDISSIVVAVIGDGPPATAARITSNCGGVWGWSVSSIEISVTKRRPARASAMRR